MVGDWHSAPEYRRQMRAWPGQRAYVDNVFNGAPLLQVIPRPNDTTTPGDASTVQPRTFGFEGTFRF